MHVKERKKNACKRDRFESKIMCKQKKNKVCLQRHQQQNVQKSESYIMYTNKSVQN